MTRRILTYRDELDRVAYEAMQQTTGGGFGDGKPFGDPANMLCEAEIGDVAAAIAARVLSDLLHAFDASQGYSDSGTERLIRQWAAARGITLEPQP